MNLLCSLRALAVAAGCATALTAPALAAPAWAIQPVADDPAATKEVIAATDAEIEAATVMAHFVWTLERFSRFMEGYTKLYPDRAELGRDLSARWHNDQEEALDVYSKLLFQISAGPLRDRIEERIGVIRQDMDNRGQEHLKAYLPVLLRHVLELQSGQTPERDTLRADLLKVPNAAGAN